MEREVQHLISSLTVKKIRRVSEAGMGVGLGVGFMADLPLVVIIVGLGSAVTYTMAKAVESSRRRENNVER